MRYMPNERSGTAMVSRFSDVLRRKGTVGKRSLAGRLSRPEFSRREFHGENRAEVVGSHRTRVWTSRSHGTNLDPRR